ncbi:MAG: hypothetical protein MR902_02450 [Campylobacter sp.]|nr:hypothetical protein [Campylobacter sp.]
MQRELKSLELKKLGLNELQMSEYFAKEEKEQDLEQLRSKKRYYELLGDKVRASNLRLQISEIELRDSGYTDEQIANSLYGTGKSRQNYENLNSAMGYDMGIAGQIQSRLNSIDEFNAMELERINAHYAALEDTQANHLAKQNELERLAMQTRMSQAGVGF